MSSLALTLGGRYAASRRSFISFISIVAIAGLVLSVAVLVIVLSVMNGFEHELETRLLGVLPHVTLYGRRPIEDAAPVMARIDRVPGVLGSSPVVRGAGLVTGPEAVAGAAITGIDPARHDRVSDLGQFVVGGRLEDLEAGDFDVLLGIRLARDLGVEVGGDVTIVLPEASVTPFGIFPRQKRFEVAGLVDSGSELDQRSAYIHVADAVRLFRTGGGAQGIEVRVDDVLAAPAMADRLVDMLGANAFRATSWMRQHGNLYRAIGVQKATMFVLLSILVAVAAFNLVSSLIMIVNQRRYDVAVLRTLGCRTPTLVLAFVVLGSLIGILGVAVGLGAGVALAHGAENGFAWLNDMAGGSLMNQYFIDYLPVEVRSEDLVSVAATALALCLLSTVYPAFKAAALNPADVLRHE